MPRRPEERILLLDGQPLHRLVAAGVDGADGDGPPVRPVEHLRVGAILRLLVGKRVAGEQELGAHQADAVAGADVDAVDLLRPGDVDHHVDRPAVGGLRVGVEIAGRLDSPLRPVPRAASRHKRSCEWPGLSTTAPVSPSTIASMWPSTSIAPRPTTIGTPRARASIATWLVALPSPSATPPPRRPVGLEEAGRRHVVAGRGSRPAERLRGRRRRDCGARGREGRSDRRRGRGNSRRRRSRSRRSRRSAPRPTPPRR